MACKCGYREEIESLQSELREAREEIERLNGELREAVDIAWEQLEDELTGCEASNDEPCVGELECMAHVEIRTIRERHPEWETKG